MRKVQKVRRDEKLRIVNEILEEDGCVVIENMLGDARREALEAEIHPLLDATVPCQGNFYGFATKRLSGLIAKSKACRLMSVDPRILAVMDAFLLKKLPGVSAEPDPGHSDRPGRAATTRPCRRSDVLLRASGTGSDDQLHVGGRRLHEGERRDIACARQPFMAAGPGIP
jgi:hypothetical protein